MKLCEYAGSLRGKRIAVCGIGISNTPLIELLLQNGCEVTARDRRERAALGELAERLEAGGARLILGADYLRDLDGDVIFRTPGIMPWQPELAAATARGARLTSEMEAFFEVCPCKIIAVTGSDGKTTTTSVIAALLRAEGYTAHIGGNIGAPLLTRADAMRETDYAVLELSSFQLMTMTQSPDVAVVTNVAPNHLDIHRDMDEYTAAKRAIFEHQSERGRLVVNYDNRTTRGFADGARGEVIYFSRKTRPEKSVYLDGGTIMDATGGSREKILEVSDIFIPGVHNIENYMAAAAATRGLVSNETLRRTAREFQGVAHRIELVRELRGVRYYNDSIASSPSRTIAGLRSFDRKVILIAGGKDKGVPFDELGPEVVAHVKTLVLTGLTAERIRDAVTRCKEYGGSPEIILEPDFALAVKAASDAASAGDTVILSPACTSFDRFKNFEERGNYFKELINGID
ncbi:MAG: UDP-N-acetylmuramoyl-L-alanine--D-glutamate ligase [Oscillospiraceae bacterium]|nr:UDP-N-acetylmuramoyl-L-alanine--D-glutamate ligase [Oscillospiraceae bacterium]